MSTSSSASSSSRSCPVAIGITSSTLFFTTPSAAEANKPTSIDDKDNIRIHKDRCIDLRDSGYRSRRWSDEGWRERQTEKWGTGWVTKRNGSALLRRRRRLGFWAGKREVSATWWWDCVRHCLVFEISGHTPSHSYEIKDRQSISYFLLSFLLSLFFCEGFGFSL